MRNKAGLIAGAVFVLATISVSALGTNPTITVDGQTYQATKVTPGGTIHFETPDTNPQVAFTDRHQWAGNGAEHLPCEAGIHWIDNDNLLTVSHCLEETESTTTTTVVETTTTAPSTTTTLPEQTTTTLAETTTTDPESTTTTVPVTSTTVTTPTTPSDPPELPFTGLNHGLWVSLALGLVASGGLILRAVRGN